MGKVINLNKYRKRKAKLEREKQADVNRRLHGRSAAERARDEAQKRQLTRAVDGAKLDAAARDDRVDGEAARGHRDDGSEDAPEPGG